MSLCFAHANATLISVYTRRQWQSSMRRARLTPLLFLAGGIFKIRITFSRLRLGAQPVYVIAAQVRAYERVAREVPVADIDAACYRQVVFAGRDTCDVLTVGNRLSVDFRYVKRADHGALYRFENQPRSFACRIAPANDHSAARLGRHALWRCGCGTAPGERCA